MGQRTWEQSRRAPRLPGADYGAPGPYFVTIGVQDRERRLSTIVDGCLRLSAAGEMIEAVWQALPARFPTVALDAYVLMPDHFHALLIFGEPAAGVETTTFSRPTLPGVIGWFKSVSTARYRRGVYLGKWPSYRKRFWQRSYYDRIVRNDQELIAFRRYIGDNPLKWDK